MPGWLNKLLTGTTGQRKRYTSRKKRYPMSFYTSRKGGGHLSARLRRGTAGMGPGRRIRAQNRLSQGMSRSYKEGGRQAVRQQQAQWRKTRGRRT